jgi:hypothetical protein
MTETEFRGDKVRRRVCRESCCNPVPPRAPARTSNELVLFKIRLLRYNPVHTTCHPRHVGGGGV